MKTTGLLRFGHLLTSADSLAWSYAARREPPLPACTTRHRNCANCPTYATTWRTRLLHTIATHPIQPTLFDQPHSHAAIAGGFAAEGLPLS